MIEQMISILGQDVRHEAEAFAYAVPLMTEWEGMSEGPVDEATRARHEKGLWPILARRYREAIDLARSSTNLLISCIADDLEAQAFVYLEGQGRP